VTTDARPTPAKPCPTNCADRARGNPGVPDESDGLFSTGSHSRGAAALFALTPRFVPAATASASRAGEVSVDAVENRVARACRLARSHAPTATPEYKTESPDCRYSRAVRPSKPFGPTLFLRATRNRPPEPPGLLLSLPGTAFSTCAKATERNFAEQVDACSPVASNRRTPDALMAAWPRRSCS
jgi:hypothetical protein